MHTHPGLSARGGSPPAMLDQSAGAPPTPPGPAGAGDTSPAGRIAWIDWLRVLALLGVFVIHVAEVFNPWDEWHVTNAERSRVVGEVALLMAPWIMPLFMLLAGMSAWYALERRTNVEYVGERVRRVLVPLAVGVVVLVPPQLWAERRLRGQFDGSLLAFYPHAFEGGLYPRGNLSWHHLWFLAHLFVYSVVALPLLRYWRRPAGRAQLQRVAQLCAGRAGLLWLALPLLAERHLVWFLYARHDLPTTDWSDQWMLFVVYLYGCVLAGEPTLGRDLDAQWPRAVALAGAIMALLMWLAWIGLVPTRLPPRSALGAVAFWTVYTLGAWACVVAVLGAARRFLRADARALGIGRRLGYEWYLVHQPVIVLVAAWVVTWSSRVPVKLAAVTLLSLAGTLGAASLLAEAGSAWARLRRSVAAIGHDSHRRPSAGTRA